MKNTVIIVILTLLTGSSYLLLKSLQKKEVKAQTTEEKTVIATASGVTARYFNEKNQLQYKLISPKVVEYSSPYGMAFASPNLTVLGEQQQVTWQGHADNGFLSEKKDELALKNNVSIIQAPNEDKPTYIDGEVMNYYANTHLIISDLPVMIDDGVVKQLSDTLRMNTRSKQLDAEKRVRAVYQVNSKKTPKADQ